MSKIKSVVVLFLLIIHVYQLNAFRSKNKPNIIEYIKVNHLKGYELHGDQGIRYRYSLIGDFVEIGFFYPGSVIPYKKQRFDKNNVMVFDSTNSSWKKIEYDSFHKKETLHNGKNLTTIYSDATQEYRLETDFETGDTLAYSWTRFGRDGLYVVQENGSFAQWRKYTLATWGYSGLLSGISLVEKQWFDQAGNLCEDALFFRKDRIEVRVSGLRYKYDNGVLSGIVYTHPNKLNHCADTIFRRFSNQFTSVFNEYKPGKFGSLVFPVQWLDKAQGESHFQSDIYSERPLTDVDVNAAKFAHEAFYMVEAMDKVRMVHLVPHSGDNDLIRLIETSEGNYYINAMARSPFRKVDTIIRTAEYTLLKGHLLDSKNIPMREKILSFNGSSNAIELLSKLSVKGVFCDTIYSKGVISGFCQLGDETAKYQRSFYPNRIAEVDFIGSADGLTGHLKYKKSIFSPTGYEYISSYMKKNMGGIGGNKTEGMVDERNQQKMRLRVESDTVFFDHDSSGYMLRKGGRTKPRSVWVKCGFDTYCPFLSYEFKLNLGKPEVFVSTAYNDSVKSSHETYYLKDMSFSVVWIHSVPVSFVVKKGKRKEEILKLKHDKSGKPSALLFESKSNGYREAYLPGIEADQLYTIVFIQ